MRGRNSRRLGGFHGEWGDWAKREQEQKVRDARIFRAHRDEMKKAETPPPLPAASHPMPSGAPIDVRSQPDDTSHLTPDQSKRLGYNHTVPEIGYRSAD